MRNRLRQKIFQRDAIASHQQAALRLERLREGGGSGMGLRRAAAFNLDCRQFVPDLYDEIYLMD